MDLVATNKSVWKVHVNACECESESLKTFVTTQAVFADEMGHHLLVEHHMGGTSLGGKIPGEKHRKATAISIVS